MVKVNVPEIKYSQFSEDLCRDVSPPSQFDLTLAAVISSSVFFVHSCTALIVGNFVAFPGLTHCRLEMSCSVESGHSYKSILLLPESLYNSPQIRKALLSVGGERTMTQRHVHADLLSPSVVWTRLII